MKINRQRGITSSQSIQKKRQTNSNFGSLLNAEIQASEHTKSTQQQESYPQNTQALFEEATALLDQALIQLSEHDTPSKDTLHAIEHVREQLSSLSHQDPVLSEAETLLSVESKRIQLLNHE